MGPFFSIVIPTYNRAHLLKAAVDSVLQQTFSDWELIIVDDGSIDNTREIIALCKDERIRYVYQENSERSAARNNGIRHSLGLYICFLDSDDYYLPQRLELLYESIKIKRNPVAAFFTNLIVEDKGVRRESKEPVITSNVFDCIATSAIHSQQTCIHKNILSTFNSDTNFRIGEDMELWFRIADKFPFIYLKEQSKVVVVQHEERSINVKKGNIYEEQLQMLKRAFLYNHPGSKVSSKIKQQLLSNAYFGMSKYFIYSDENFFAIKNLCFSISEDLLNRQNKYRIHLLIRLLSKNGIKQARKILD